MSRQPSSRRGASLTRFYLLLAAIAVLGAGALAFTVLGDGARLPFASRTLDAAELTRLGDRAVGAADAPLTVVEFADFQCGACAVYAQQIVPKIKGELVEQGLVRYVFVDFPLDSHPHAVLAARAARCANDQGAFWPYHDRVYAQHSEWAFDSDPTAKLVSMAEAVGVDRTRFQRCLASGEHAETVAASRELGESVGVRATPSLVVNGRLLDYVPTAEDLRRLAEEELANRPGSAAGSGGGTGGR